VTREEETGCGDLHRVGWPIVEGSSLLVVWSWNEEMDYGWERQQTGRGSLAPNPGRGRGDTGGGEEVNMGRRKEGKVRVTFYKKVTGG